MLPLNAPKKRIRKPKNNPVIVEPEKTKNSDLLVSVMTKLSRSKTIKNELNIEDEKVDTKEKLSNMNKAMKNKLNIRRKSLVLRLKNFRKY